MLSVDWHHAPLPRSFPGLSVRHTELLLLVAAGYANKQIARELGISVWTVKNHFKVIFARLQVESRTQAVLVAWKRGWIQ